MDRKRKNNWPEFVRSLLKKKRTAFTTWVVLHSTQQDDNNLYTSYNSTHTADIQGKGQWRNDQLSSAISSFYTYPSFACAPRPSEESYRGLCCSLPLWNGTIHQVPLISSVVISHQQLLSLRHFQWGLFPFGLHELFNFRQKETKKTLQTHLLLSHQIQSAIRSSNSTLNALICLDLEQMPFMLFMTGDTTWSKPVTFEHFVCWWMIQW